MALSTQERAKVRSARMRVRGLKSNVGKVKGYLSRNERPKAARLLTAMGHAADLAEAELGQVGSVDPGPVDPGPVDPPVTPPPPPPDDESVPPDAIRGGRHELTKLKAGSYVYRGEIVWPSGQPIASHITLRDCDHLPGSDPLHPGYINNGHEPKDVSLQVLGGTFKNFGKGTLETKAVDGRFDGVAGEWNLRIRHGRNLMVTNCPGLKAATVRGHDHYIDAPNAAVMLWAGNLPAHFDGPNGWDPDRKGGSGPKHKPGGGRNWECAEACKVRRARTVLVGEPISGESSFPALNNVIHESLQGVTKRKAEKGTRFEAFD